MTSTTESPARQGGSPGTTDRRRWLVLGVVALAS